MKLASVTFNFFSITELESGFEWKLGDCRGVITIPRTEFSRQGVTRHTMGPIQGDPFSGKEFELVLAKAFRHPSLDGRLTFNDDTWRRYQRIENSQLIIFL